MGKLIYERSTLSEKLEQNLGVFEQHLKLQKDTFRVAFRGVCKYPYGGTNVRWTHCGTFKKDKISESYIQQILEKHKTMTPQRIENMEGLCWDKFYLEMNSILDNFVVDYCKKYKLDESQYSDFGMEVENDLDPEYVKEYGQNGPLVLFPIQCFVTYCDKKGKHFKVSI